MDYIEVSVPNAEKEIMDILVAELAAIGFEGFENDETLLKAYISSGLFEEEPLNDVLTSYNVTAQIHTIQQQNWNAEWESNFQPVTVEGFCTIRADFHEPDNSVEHDIIITPKMSFGTGHHATTQLMILQMKDMDFTGKDVLDFGTGTGVLAILAKRLGAAETMAIDTDEWSYGNTLENIERNGATGIDVKKGSLEVVAGAKYDIILANINRHILLQYMSAMQEMLKGGGMVLMSGILDEDRSIIVEQAEICGLKEVNQMIQENWISILFTKQ